MTDNLFKTESFDWLNQPFALESPETLPSTLVHKRGQVKRKHLSALRQEKLEEFLTALPNETESLHIVSNGSFDYWHFVPVCLRLLGTPVDEFYGSTWTMNRPNALHLLELLDTGQIKSATLFSGLYFKRRETAVYTTIASGLLDRGQRFLCFENHSKIILLKSGEISIVIEGSANFTANPRVEQNIVSRDAELYAFHRTWMEELLTRNGKQKRANEIRGQD